VVKRTFNHYRW